MPNSAATQATGKFKDFHDLLLKWNEFLQMDDESLTKITFMLKYSNDIVKIINNTEWIVTYSNFINSKPELKRKILPVIESIMKYYNENINRLFLGVHMFAISKVNVLYNYIATDKFSINTYTPKKCTFSLDPNIIEKMTILQNINNPEYNDLAKNTKRETFYKLNRYISQKNPTSPYIFDEKIPLSNILPEEFITLLEKLK